MECRVWGVFVFEEYEERSMKEMMKEIGMDRRIGVIMSRDT